MWRHSCFSLDRATGMFRLVEDGLLRYQRQLSTDDVSLLSQIGDTANIVTVGCMYWNRVNKYMSMLGSVTDVQVYCHFSTNDRLM